MSFRDVEDLLAERGIIVSYKTIRQWCGKFGPTYARALKKRQGRLGDTWYLDEMFIEIRGELRYLWRAVDQDGDTIDILVQKRRIDGPSATISHRSWGRWKLVQAGPTFDPCDSLSRVSREGAF